MKEMDCDGINNEKRWEPIDPILRHLPLLSPIGIRVRRKQGFSPQSFSAQKLSDAIAELLYFDDVEAIEIEDFPDIQDEAQFNADCQQKPNKIRIVKIGNHLEVKIDDTNDDVEISLSAREVHPDKRRFDK